MAKKIYTVRFRQEFIETWTRYTGTFLEHCERWGITRQTGYDWLDKVHLGGFEGTACRARFARITARRSSRAAHQQDCPP